MSILQSEPAEVVRLRKNINLWLEEAARAGFGVSTNLVKIKVLGNHSPTGVQYDGMREGFVHITGTKPAPADSLVFWLNPATRRIISIAPDGTEKTVYNDLDMFD